MRRGLPQVAAVENVIDIAAPAEQIIRTQLRPHGMLRLLTPALGWWMHRTLDEDLRKGEDPSRT
jgi:hypothetical protein